MGVSVLRVKDVKGVLHEHLKGNTRVLIRSDKSNPRVFKGVT